MKIWQIRFVDSAYSKYESKPKLPLLQNNALISVFQTSFSAFRPDHLRQKAQLYCNIILRNRLSRFTRLWAQ